MSNGITKGEEKKGKESRENTIENRRVFSGKEERKSRGNEERQRQPQRRERKREGIQAPQDFLKFYLPFLPHLLSQK